MRSIWNGAVSFGLVSIPVKLMNATENHSISFRQIHMEDGGRIRYRKFCDLEDAEVTTDEIGKGYEDADGTVIEVTDEDLAQLPLPTTKTIEIVAFVPADRIDPIQMTTPYYLSANGAPATKPYTVLREALKDSDKVAVARFALRGRERLGMLRVVDDVIAMHALLWPDEIRPADNVAPDTNVTVRDKELDLADALMNTLGEVDLDDLHDDYREALSQLIEAKIAGENLPEPGGDTGTGGKVIDLMAALERSVEAARESKGGGGKGAEVTELRGRERKRAPAKKTTPAKKTAAAKTASGKKTTDAKKATGSGSGNKKTAAKKQTTEKSGTRKSVTQKPGTKKAAAKKKTSA
ncbi:Ku protein [Streptomyces sp. NPDC059785]|uniref:non-homologous end joining protein Ku n=1 Tax=Streptomyces sp. NPDC059785 TaxID=3346945 RepID=UPI003669B962